jgi:hypothetical protein
MKITKKKTFTYDTNGHVIGNAQPFFVDDSSVQHQKLAAFFNNQNLSSNGCLSSQAKIRDHLNSLDFHCCLENEVWLSP